MTEAIHVQFNVQKGKREEFLDWLQKYTGDGPFSMAPNYVIGYRADDQVQRREALTKFVNEMELVLRRHDSKKTWRERPVTALIQLMLLELKEFEIAFEHFEIKEARKELVDLSNYALIVYDRLGLLDVERNYHVQQQDVERAEAERRQLNLLAGDLHNLTGRPNGG